MSARRIASVVCLAFALALGQLGGLLHGLAHAAERIAQKQDSKPASAPCDQCFLAGQLSGPAPAAMPDVPAVEHGFETNSFALAEAPAATAVVFRSRAPPVLP